MTAIGISDHKVVEQNSIPSSLPILVATSDQKVGKAIDEQLSVDYREIHQLIPRQAADPLELQKCSPKVAFIGCDEVSRGGIPLYRLVLATCPQCQVILICETNEQTESAANLVRLGDVFDYMCVSSMLDLHRVSLLVERAREQGGLSASMVGAKCPLHHGGVLETVTELRDVIKSVGDANLSQALINYRPTVGNPSTKSVFARAKNDSCSPVDLICGELRRVENYIVLSSTDQPEVNSKPGPPLTVFSAPGHDEQVDPVEGRILVVDDDEICIDLAQSVLEKSGFMVDVADGPLSALRAMRAQKPDLILMDVHLDGANGIEFVAAIQERGFCSDVPILLITSDRTRRSVMSAIRVDVEGYILKPYDTDFMINKIRRVLLESRSQTLVDVAEVK